MKRIVVNKIRCNKCGDIIESKSVYDFVTCKCGAVSVDGGHNYLRRCAESLEDFEELSQYGENLSVADAVRQFVGQSGDKYTVYENYSGRNMFGRKCLGVVVRKGYSYMEMLIDLTCYLEEQGLEDEDLEMEGIAVDDLGLDTIVYFPNMKM